MAYKNLSMVRGDTQVYNLCFKDSNGNPFNIKNWVVKFTIKKHYGLLDSAASVQKTITTFPDTTGGTCGSAQIVLYPVDTVNLEPGEYVYDIQVTRDQNDTYTIMRGKMEIEYDVTRTPGTAGTMI